MKKLIGFSLAMVLLCCLVARLTQAEYDPDYVENMVSRSHARDFQVLPAGGVAEFRSLEQSHDHDCFQIGRMRSRGVVPGASTILRPEDIQFVQAGVGNPDFVGFELVIKRFDAIVADHGTFTVERTVVLRSHSAALPRCSNAN